MSTTSEPTYADLRAAIKKEKERRFREHQENIAARQRMIATLPSGGQAT